MDSDYTYPDALDGSETWAPLEVVMEALKTSGIVLQVDTRAWSGIHLAPGDTATIQPVVRIVTNG